MLMILERVIVGLFNAYTWILLIYCVLTWFPVNHGIIADIRRVLSKLVEPVLNPLRKVIPPIGGMVDITPIIALVVLQLIVRLLLWIL